MTIEDIKFLKDKIYEIEGLLELAQMREDKIAELEPLINERLAALAPQPASAKVETPVNTISELFEESETVSVSSQPEWVPEPASEETEETKEDEPDEVKPIMEQPRHAVEKPAFCLNDRFRFKRELFGNSDAEFSQAMNMVAAMEDYEEAEEYFLGELGWDAENQEVIDFLAIIKNYFG